MITSKTRQSEILQSNNDNKGIVKALRLELHGTREMPDHVKKTGGRRHYNYQYNAIQDTRAVSTTCIFVASLRSVTYRSNVC